MRNTNSGTPLSSISAAVALVAVLVMAWRGADFAWLALVGAAGVVASAVFGVFSGSSLPAAAGPASEPAQTAAGEGDTPREIDPSREKMLLMSGELAAAREIQTLLVPRTFPPLRGCPPFDLYAVLDPAREIGGDFYDYWMLGKDHLALVVADVSGKGIPSALYMAMARTYLRAFSRQIHDPAGLLTRLNREVARHNPGNMFVTVFCSVIDLKTGAMEYASAGHNPPLRWRRGQPAKWFDFADNPPVGFIPDLAYLKRETKLESGEMLLLYTDGVTEAMNGSNEMIGEARVAEMFAGAADTADSCRAVVMSIQSNLSDFAGDRDSYDDITIMAYRHPDDEGWAVHDSGQEGEAEMGDTIMASFGTIGSDSVSNKFFSLTDLK